MDNEVWKDIKGFEGKYQVSNMGRVKSLNYKRTGKEKLLSPQNDGWGYTFVSLCKEGKHKMHKVHRLVLQTFAPCENMENLEVNHLNEFKDDNRLENLEWCDRRYNLTYNDLHKRVAEKNSIPIVQLTIEGRYIRSYKSSMDAQRLGGFTQQKVNSCCRGKRKTHKGYKWMYLSEFLDKNNGIID